MYNERDRVGLSRSRAIEKIALFYVAVLAGLLHRFPANFTQQTAGQIRNRESGGSAGAKASEQGEAITFADVAGVDEAKAELEEIVEFLRNPDNYIRLGACPPCGVLLELWNLQWLAGIAVYHVQMIREVAIPSEELHLEKKTKELDSTDLLSQLPALRWLLSPFLIARLNVLFMWSRLVHSSSAATREHFC